MTNKAKVTITVVLFLFSILLFYLVNLLTITPNTISGNGNLGLIPMFFAVPVFIGFNVCYFVALCRCLRHRANKIKYMIVVICCILLILVVVCEMYFVNDLFESLGGWDDPDSKLYRYPLLNQYTNPIFFNVFTFIGFVWMTTLIGTSYSLRKIRH